MAMVRRARSLLAMAVLGIALALAFATPATAEPGDSGWSPVRGGPDRLLGEPGDSGWGIAP